MLYNNQKYTAINTVVIFDSKFNDNISQELCDF